MNVLSTCFVNTGFGVGLFECKLFEDRKYISLFIFLDISPEFSLQCSLNRVGAQLKLIDEVIVYIV